MAAILYRPQCVKSVISEHALHIKHFSWNFCYQNTKEDFWLRVNSGSGDDLVPPGNKP